MTTQTETNPTVKAYKDGFEDGFERGVLTYAGYYQDIHQCLVHAVSSGHCLKTCECQLCIICRKTLIETRPKYGTTTT